MSNKDPKPKDPKRGLTRLHDLEPAEISLVDSGANRRRMLVLKRSDIGTVDKGGPGSGPHPGGGSSGEKKPKEKKDPKTMTVGELQKEHEKLSAKSSELTTKLIEAGHGSVRSHDMYNRAAENPLFGQYKELADRHMDLRAEAERRGGPGMMISHLSNIHNKSRVRKAGEPDDMEHAELVAKGGPGSGPRKGGGSGAERGAGDSKQELGNTRSGKPVHVGGEGAKAHAEFSAQDHTDAAALHSKAAEYARSPDREKPSVNDAATAKHHDTMASIHRESADKARKGGVHKAAGSLRDMIAKTDPAVLAAVDKAFDGYVKKDAGGEPDPQMVAAGKAVARILTPFKDSMPPALAHQIVDLAGFNMGDMGDEQTEPGAMRVGDGVQDVEKAYHPVDEDEDSEDEQDGVKKRDVAAAAKAANCVYKETMAKLGYRQYPDAQISMKRGGSPVNKKGEHVSKSAADTQVTDAPDLSGIADPKTRSAVELVMKSQRELVAKNAALETSNADLKKSLDDQKAETRKKELVAKAAGWQHLAVPQDDLVAQLVDADKAGKDAFERVEKNFNALNAQAKAGGLFNELGSNLPAGANSADALYAKMEAAAQGWVQKSGGEKCSKAEAVAKFMETPEGSKMYAEHQAARGGI